MVIAILAISYLQNQFQHKFTPSFLLFTFGIVEIKRILLPATLADTLVHLTGYPL